jgi:hypothetical protein
MTRPKDVVRACFFHVVDGLIRFQRGYWDRLSFDRLRDTGRAGDHTV